MVNYKSRADEEIGASLIGGALEMLSQYDANNAGDEYSENNPTDEYVSQLGLADSDAKSLSDLGGSLIGGEDGEYKGGSKIGGSLKARKEHAVKKILALTPLAFHHLTEIAGIARNTDLTHQSKLTQMLRKHRELHNLHHEALHDIMNAKSKSHLARMIKKDVEIEGKVGGEFWNTLGGVSHMTPAVLPILD